MFKKSIEISWNLLHILDDDWKKTVVLQHELETKFKNEVTFDYLRQIINQLSYHGLIETKRNAGVRRCFKQLIFFDEVLKAFEVNLTYPVDSPYNEVMRKVVKVVRRANFNNAELL